MSNKKRWIKKGVKREREELGGMKGEETGIKYCPYGESMYLFYLKRPSYTALEASCCPREYHSNVASSIDLLISRLRRGISSLAVESSKLWL